MNCQQIRKLLAKRLNRNENIPASFRGGGTFLKHPVGLEDTFWICLCFSVIALSTSHKSLVIFML